MTADELREIIACGETSTVQFKLKFSTAKQIAEEMVAFANSKGGMMVFGVEDKTGQIIGLSYSEIQKLSNEVSTVANDQVRPVIYLQTEVVIVDGKRLLVAYVNQGSNKPYKTLSGNIWVKQGSDKRRIVENNEILSLFQASGSYHADEAVISGTSMTDLEVAYINDYFQRVYGKPKESFGMPVDKLLTSLGILGQGGQVTRAGMLFFGQYPQMRMPTYTIKAVAYYGNDIGGSDYRDSRDIIGTVPTMFREGMSFLKSNLHHLQAGQNFNSVGKLEIPEVVLEELLQNALVHVDLLGSAYIRLLIFDNRIEIINPGSLFGGLTVEDIRLGKSKQRNHLMAEFCARTMIYRGLGSGIPRVLKENVKIDFVSDDNTGDFKTIIWRDTELAVLEEGSEKSGNGSPESLSKSSPKAGEGSEKTEESTQKTEKGSPKIGESSEKTDKSTQKTEKSSPKTDCGSEKTDISSPKGSPKTKDLIIEIIKEDQTITTAEIAERLRISKRAVIKHTNNLQLAGIIRHVGSLKGGHWEVAGMSEKISD